MLGVNNNHVVMMKRKGQSKRGHNNNKKDVKVTYISSPMKVKTSASNFRALVQELTGQASNVAEMFVEPHDHYYHDNDGVHNHKENQQWGISETFFPDSTTCLNLKQYDDDYFSHSRSPSIMEPSTLYMDIFNMNY